jgi:predicted AAA+ superfamily ATPase
VLLGRRLNPWHGNIGKRLVRAPKIYVRDSGLLHQLLGIGDRETLLGHPIVGASWEGFMIENILNSIPPEIEAHFYRTSAGAEIDLLLAPPGQKTIAIEIKRSLSPSVSKEFYIAAEDVGAGQRFLLYPRDEGEPPGIQIGSSRVVARHHAQSY